MIKFILLFFGLLVYGCTTPSYPSIDHPTQEITPEDSQIIAYIDQRLEEEYYWLDEVIKRSLSFDRRVPWANYMGRALTMLSTNGDDGYINAKGERVLYSYIREVDAATRSTAVGYGINLYFTVVSVGDDRLGFIVSNVYRGSAAEASDVRRGDVIVNVNGEDVTMNNYMTLFNSIHQSKASSLRLHIQRQTAESEQDKSHIANLTPSSYIPSTVAYHDIIEIEGSEQRIGYLVYTGFDNKYDEELLAALASFALEPVTDLILDLRHNGGGDVASAVKLCSAIVDASHRGSLLFELRRNPHNVVHPSPSLCYVEDCGIAIAPATITIICSSDTASAAEMIITGLRGLDIPITLIGTTTEGKNCGMDVTRVTIGERYLEYAPITFMCYNAKGFCEYGEGIAPDVDLCGPNKYGVEDKHYPLPRCPWGDLSHDIALVTAVASATGKSVSQDAATRGAGYDDVDVCHRIASPVVGALLYNE